MTLDVYQCTFYPEDFAVKEGKEPQLCPFCQSEVTFNYSTEEGE